jgi:hypothetical protein
MLPVVPENVVSLTTTPSGHTSLKLLRQSVSMLLLKHSKKLNRAITAIKLIILQLVLSNISLFLLRKKVKRLILAQGQHM